MLFAAWLLPQASALPPGPLAPLGADRLDEVAELRFALTRTDGGAVSERAWVWAVGTGRVTGRGPDGAVSFDLGHPRSPAERDAERAFLEDTFWLAPQLHVRWAGSEATLVDHGLTTFFGHPARRMALQYGPAGGYTPGDAHDLFVDPAGHIVGWQVRPASRAEPTVAVAVEDYVAVGPLQLATVRRAADGSVPVRFHDLGWLPSGVGVTVEPGGVEGLLRVTSARCTLGPVAVARRTSGTSVHPTDGGSRTRRLAVGEGEDPVFGDVLSARDGAAPALHHRWSASALALEDGDWLVTSGILDCDFRALPTDDLRRVLDGASAQERHAVLTLLLEWTLAEVSLPAEAAPILRRVRERARSCAATGRCEDLYAWFERL